MPKPFKYIHAKDKPQQLENQRKQELERHPANVPFRMSKEKETIELNTYSLMFFILLNAEIIKFGSSLKTNHPISHIQNSHVFFGFDNKAFKNTGTRVETKQSGFKFRK